MSKKNMTKIDPRKELSLYLNHQFNQTKKHKKKAKISASLSGLKNERKRSLVKKLGLIIGIAIISIVSLSYYISPLANVNKIQIKGADDLPAKKIVKYSGIKASDQVLDYRFNSQKLNNKLVGKYPEVRNVKIRIHNLNNLVIYIQEYPTNAYVKDKGYYRKILTSGKIGSQPLTWSKIDQNKPLFIGYNQKTTFKNYLKLFNSLPVKFRNEVKVLSGNIQRKSQIILVMKDGNLVIGNIATLKRKIKYYDAIKEKAGKNSLIDLEVGAFSQPLTSNEKKIYDIS